MVRSPASPRAARTGVPKAPKPSQETLADMVGTTHARVSHFMNKFRQLGYIDYKGDLEVHSSLLDAVLHEKPQIKMPW
jgi:CRP/FNR family cyclic AMP-dependent transcriptional regulator